MQFPPPSKCIEMDEQGGRKARPCKTEQEGIGDNQADADCTSAIQENLESLAQTRPASMWQNLSRMSRRAFRFGISRALRCGPIPDHVAFIMDGNRRWAERRNLQRHAGHEFGFLQLKECLKWCLDLGIRVVTVYAFSIENFKRPSTEVETLMRLAEEKLLELVEEQGFLQRNNVRVQVLGALELLPPHVQRAAAKAMRVSRHHDRAVLNICMAYTAREEMLTAVREVVCAAHSGELQPSDVTEELLSSVLYTAPHSQALQLRTFSFVPFVPCVLLEVLY
jgi:undecaprenyl diphosphate synthase